MKEKENYQDQGVQLPPTWCSGICRNAMNEVCIENCAIKRNCSAFEPKPNLKLEDMPRFPLKESATMTKEEKFTVVTVYLAKVVDHLNGMETDLYALNPPHTREGYQASEARTTTKTASYLTGIKNGVSGIVAEDAASHQIEPLKGVESTTGKESE